MSLDFGFGRTLVAERWNPVRVTIDAGERAISGAVVAEFVQDGSQVARVQTAFAAVPGTPSLVTLAIAPPPSCSRVDFSLIDDSGRVRSTLECSAGESSVALSMPNIVPADTGLIVGVGRAGECVRGLRSALAELATGQRTDGSLVAGMGGAARLVDWKGVGGAQALTEQLPLHAMEYAGMLALVASADSTIGPDPRALDAMHEWVRGGGRLVLLADAAGPAWMRWAPEEVRARLALDEPESIATPGSLRARLDEIARTLRSARAARESAAPNDGSDVSVSTASSVRARPMRLQSGAASRGWTLEHAMADGRGLLAHGPVGLGYVVVLGADPQRCFETLSTSASLAAWVDAIAPALADRRAIAGPTQETGWNFYGASRAGQAIDQTIQRVANVPDFGVGSFAFIAVGMVALALLVGPLDYIALTRLRIAHRSWLTALVWVGVVTLGAYAVPRYLRTEPTRIDRFGVIDAIATPLGAGAEGGGARTPDGVSRATSVTGIYSSGAGWARVTASPRGAWFRGVGVQTFQFGGDTRPRAVLPTVQSSPMGGGDRACVIGSIPLSLWTFRAVLDDAPGPALAARVRVDERGASVMVRGLPEGARVERASWVLGDRTRWLGEGAGSMDGALWSARLGSDQPAAETSPRPTRRSARGWVVQQPAASPGDLDTEMLNLPGPDRRALAIDTLARAGWGVLTLRVRQMGDAFTVDRAGERSHGALVRLLVPPEAIEGAPLPQAPPSQGPTP